MKPIETRSSVRFEIRLAALVMMAAAVLVGCTPTSQKTKAKISQSASSRAETSRQIFDYAAGLLNRPREFDTFEATVGAVEKLNEWLATEPEPAWTPPAMLADLPPDLAERRAVKDLSRMRFTDLDALELRMAVWLREIAARQSKDGKDTLDVASRLFDWTVRNIQLETRTGEDPAQAPPLSAWHVLLLGRGTAAERAWIFALLARQQNLDVVILAREPQEGGENPVPWACALFHDEDLYLFDPVMGLAIPKADGTGVATLAEAAADERVFRQLDLGPDERCRLDESHVRQCQALIEASPVYLAPRMAALQAKLVGDEKLVMSLDAQSLVAKLAVVPQVDKVDLWRLPYERLQDEIHVDVNGLNLEIAALDPFRTVVVNHLGRSESSERPIWKGRTLHLLGAFDDEPSANKSYQSARLIEETRRQTVGEIESFVSMLPEEQQQEMRNFLGGIIGGLSEDEKFRLGQSFVSLICNLPQEQSHRFLEYFIAMITRNGLTDEQIAETRRQLEPLAEILGWEYTQVAKVVREDATYYLGLVAFERGIYSAAEDWLKVRTLEQYPDGRWQHGARYNLARTYEATGRLAEAISIFKADNSPQRHGNQIRARRLEAALAPAAVP